MNLIAFHQVNIDQCNNLQITKLLNNRIVKAKVKTIILPKYSGT